MTVHMTAAVAPGTPDRWCSDNPAARPLQIRSTKMVFLLMGADDESKKEMDIATLSKAAVRELVRLARVNNISLKGTNNDKKKILERFKLHSSIPVQDNAISTSQNKNKNLGDNSNLQLQNILEEWKTKKKDELYSKRIICLFIYVAILNVNKDPDKETIQV